jgi:hypothetical protein
MQTLDSQPRPDKYNITTTISRARSRLIAFRFSVPVDRDPGNALLELHEDVLAPGLGWFA